MATIGVSKPHIALYDASGGSVVYTGCVKLAKAVQFSAEISSGDKSNDLYADNGVCESDKSFAGGTLKITTDDLDQEGSALILGITPTKVTVEEKSFGNMSSP